MHRRRVRLRGGAGVNCPVYGECLDHPEHCQAGGSCETAVGQILGVRYVKGQRGEPTIELPSDEQ